MVDLVRWRGNRDDRGCDSQTTSGWRNASVLLCDRAAVSFGNSLVQMAMEESDSKNISGLPEGKLTRSKGTDLFRGVLCVCGERSDVDQVVGSGKDCRNRQPLFRSYQPDKCFCRSQDSFFG